MVPVVNLGHCLSLRRPARSFVHRIAASLAKSLGLSIIDLTNVIG
jgi:hypothetical protein